MTPQQQQATIDEIVATQRSSRPRQAPAASKSGNGTRDITVTFDDGTSHVYRNAPANLTPEQVTERAQSEFGRTVTALDGGRGPSFPAAPKPPSAPSLPPVTDAKSIAEGLFPGVHITDWKRDPDSPLGRANPDSWHNRSGGAVDIRPIPGMTYEQARQRFTDAGYTLLEDIDEVKNPSGHATGPHWHFVLAGGPTATTDAPSDPDALKSGIASLINEGKGLDEIYAAFPMLANDPSNVERVKAWIAERAEGGQRPVSFDDRMPAQDPQAQGPDKTTAEQAGVLGFGDSAAFGFLDEAGAVADTILGGNKRTIWDGSSFREAYDENVAANRDTLSSALDEHPVAYAAGGIGGALIPLSRAGKAAVALDKLKDATVIGAKAGAAYGFGSDTGSITERLDGAATGAAIGAGSALGLSAGARAAAKAASPLVERLAPKLAQARFEKRQLRNAFAKVDAGVSDDLDKIVQNLLADSGKRKLKPTKTQARTLLSRVSDLENSYLPSAEVNALDLPPSVKARLDTAMAKRHLLSNEEVSALRDGTPAGEAVAEGITKARRLRAYVSEVSGHEGRTGRFLSEAIGSAAGWKLGGPIGGAAGSVVGRMAAPSAVNASAKAALDLAAKAPKFAKLPEVIASREAEGAGDSLARLSAEALDAPYLARKQAAADSEKLQREARDALIKNHRDDVRPSGGYRGLIYENTGLLPSQQDAGALKALNDGAITQDQFDAFLNAPDRLMEGKAGLAIMDRLGDLAERGTLKRDPKWKPPAPQGEADGIYSTIRNPDAYRATAKANQQRVSDTLQAVQSKDGLGDTDREALASAVTAIGNTSSRTDAEAIAAKALGKLTGDVQEYGRSVLSPLVAQVKR